MPCAELCVLAAEPSRGVEIAQGEGPVQLVTEACKYLVTSVHIRSLIQQQLGYDAFSPKRCVVQRAPAILQSAKWKAMETDTTAAATEMIVTIGIS
jgi:hypothetical protein